MSSNVLIFAAHPDDEVIGAGGFVAQLAETCDTRVVFVTDGEFDSAASRRRRTQAEAAAAILGIAGVEYLGMPTRGLARGAELTLALARAIRESSTDVLLLPHEYESDQDHAALHFAGREAIFVAATEALPGKPVQVEIALGYEVWSPIRRPDIFAPMGEREAALKMSALRAYSAEFDRFSLDTASLGLSRYRGGFFVGSEYAEAFALEHFRPSAASLIASLH